MLMSCQWIGDPRQDSTAKQNEHKESSAEIKTSNLPPVKVCLFAKQPSAITEHMWKTKVEFLPFVHLMSILYSMEQRDAKAP